MRSPCFALEEQSIEVVRLAQSLKDSLAEQQTKLCLLKAQLFKLTLMKRADLPFGGYQTSQPIGIGK